MAITIDGKEMSAQWHYDMCIDTWNWIAENGCEKSDTPHVDKYNPLASCFACEIYYKYDECNAACPFIKECGHCGWYGSPYYSWCKMKDEKESAIAIAQLFIDYYPEEVE